jgi:dCMP deaminase
MPHCEHPKNSTERCTNASHAETNVIAFAARHGSATRRSTLYVTHSPCLACSGLIIAAGIERVVFSWLYTSDDMAGLKRLVAGGIAVDKFADKSFRVDG